MALWAVQHGDQEGESLGPLLVRIRRRLGRSQLRVAEQLCALSGVPTVSRHEISRWEREERIPSPFWLTRLGEVLGIAVDELERATARTRRRRDAIRPTVPVAGWRVFELCGVTGPDGVLRLRPVGTPDPIPIR